MCDDPNELSDPLFASLQEQSVSPSEIEEIMGLLRNEIDSLSQNRRILVLSSLHNDPNLDLLMLRAQQHSSVTAFISPRSLSPFEGESRREGSCFEEEFSYQPEDLPELLNLVDQLDRAFQPINEQQVMIDIAATHPWIDLPLSTNRHARRSAHHRKKIPEPSTLKSSRKR